MGSNQKGQLGINDPQVKIKYSPILVEVLVGKKVTEVAAGDYHVLALSQGTSKHMKQHHGEVYAWGGNTDGQVGSGGSVDIVYSPRLVNFENYFSPSISKIACGGAHSAFIDEMGRLFACGANKQGQCGVGFSKCESQPIHVETITD